MRKYIVIILILISLGSYAQTPPRTGYLVQPAKWKFVNPIWLDSGAYITKISKYGGQNRYLVYDSVKGTIGYRFVSSATTIDTTSLSNRINLRVKYTDTSSMLAKYLRSADTLKLRRDVNLKVPYTGATTNVNIGANTYIGHSLKSDASDGVLLEAANGTDVGIFGAGNTANSSLYGGLTIGSITSGNGTDSVVVASSAGLLKKRPASAFGSSYTAGNGIIVGGSVIYGDTTKIASRRTPTFITNITTPLIIGGTSTTSPITYKTTTGIGATGADHIFQVGNNGTTEAMRILNSGNVGYNKLLPIAKIHAAGNGSALPGMFQNDQSATPWYNSYPSFILVNANATTNNASAFSFSDNEGYNTSAGIGATYTNRTSHYADLFFYTNSTDGYNQRLYILANGNIGIATSSPVSKFHIGVAPTASANYGLVSLGSGAFDGATSGYFTGAASGTVHAINITGTSNFADWQKSGVVKFQVDNTGGLYAAGFLQSQIIKHSTSASAISVQAALSIGPTSNLTAISATGFTQTGSTAIGIVDLSQTWNTTGNPTAIKLNVTNTASGATSKLIDLQVASTSLFNVDKSGNTLATKYSISALNTAPSSASDTGTLGEIRVTATYIYVCTATNTWVRTALATW